MQRKKTCAHSVQIFWKAVAYTFIGIALLVIGYFGAAYFAGAL